MASPTTTRPPPPAPRFSSSPDAAAQTEDEAPSLSSPKARESSPACFDFQDDESRQKIALKAAGAQLIHGPCDDAQGPRLHGLLVKGWRIQSNKHFILTMDERERWEKMLGTTHLPEMLFGNNFLELAHLATGIKIKFNALEALHDWKQENLPPVEVSAAAKWRFCSKPSQQVILDYDYTFTTPYSGSETIETEEELSSHGRSFMTTDHATSSPIQWVDCDDKIDLVALRAKDPILFYDEVVLYEDELADNGVSLLSVKVRVMPSCWFLLLRFWLRVDGVLMRLRDTRMHCSFQNDSNIAPVVIRERCHKEDTFSALALKGFPVDSSLYFDSAVASDRLTVRKQHCEKLTLKETNPKRVS